MPCSTVSSPAASSLTDWTIAYSLVPSAEYANVVRPMSLATIVTGRGDLGERQAAVGRLVEPVVGGVARPVPADRGDDLLAARAGHHGHVGHLLVVGRVVGRAGRIQHLGPLASVRGVPEQPVVGGRVCVPGLVERQPEHGPGRDRVVPEGVPDPGDTTRRHWWTVHAGARVGVLRHVGLAGAHPQRPVGRVDGQRADGQAGHAVKPASSARPGRWNATRRRRRCPRTRCRPRVVVRAVVRPPTSEKPAPTFDQNGSV